LLTKETLPLTIRPTCVGWRRSRSGVAPGIPSSAPALIPVG